ncbi:heavy metal translocating P-type ATPase [Occallatibacter savannae]|uniref:heavy metal translocating P-type ATPase n=1 Tax=Occallatibacter savannae TaxID=1002691 RepID=UPI0013A57ADD|nr:heavy metal translocating P-type ATPase [Occallatibacter savannae]
MSELRDIILLATIGIASVPICLELLSELKNRSFGVDVLAFISIGSAVWLKHDWVAAIVILMFSGGKALEDYATRRASSVLRALARRMPQIAHKQTDGGISQDIAIEEVAPGDLLLVYPHELCPVDGLVVRGNGSMDESYLTGEPFEIEKAPGAAVLSGAINGNAPLTIQATRVVSESRYARIVEVLHASEKNRPHMRRLGDRLGLWYAPLSIAVAIAAWMLSGDADRFLSILVIATPCPLLLAIPIAITSAISVSARHGIVVKDPSVLEKIGSCTTLIVDKTGTLTCGKPTLTEVVCTDSLPRRDIVQFAASLEKFSKHTLASAVLQIASDEHIPLLLPENVREEPGCGLTGTIGGRTFALTSRSKLSEETRRSISDLGAGMECVALVDGAVAGLLRFRDQPRRESQPFLRHVRSHHGFSRTILLSGDRPSEVEYFAQLVGISEIHGGKSPEEKLALVQDLTRKEPTLYIGDGINDAPAMMNATVGIALGVNSDVTSEAAGAVILQSSLASVDELIHIGDRMRRIALTSAIGGMGLSVLGMAVAAAGYLAPVEGAILQEFIDLAAILNSLRMILPSPPLSDFRIGPAQVESGRAPKRASQAAPTVYAPHRTH